MPGRRTITSLLLAAVLALPLTSFLALRLHQSYVRWEMEERLEENLLESISMPSCKLVWYKKGKEIIVDNRLFDVKNISIENGYATITGIFDDKETHIKNQLARLPHHGLDKLVNLLLGFVMDTHSPEKQTYPITNQIFDWFVAFFLSRSPDIPSPPPWCPSPN